MARSRRQCGVRSRIGVLFEYTWSMSETLRHSDFAAAAGTMKVVKGTIDRRAAVKNGLRAVRTGPPAGDSVLAKEWSGEGMCKLRGVSRRTAGWQS